MDISFVHIVIETVCCSGSGSRLLFPCGLVSHERKIMIDTNLVVSAVPVKSAPNSGSSDEFIPLPNLTGLVGCSCPVCGCLSIRNKNLGRDCRTRVFALVLFGQTSRVTNHEIRRLKSEGLLFSDEPN